MPDLVSERPKKIVIVSDTIYPYFKGGKEQRILHISTRLAKAGHEVHIYTMKWWDGHEKTVIENGVYLHGIAKLRDVYRDESRRSIIASLQFALSCLRLIKVKFDVIDVDHMPYLHLFTIWIVCKLKRKKMFATWHEVWGYKYWKEYLGILGTMGFVMEWLAAHLPTYILTNSDDTRRKLIERHPYRKSRILAAYNGVNLTEIYETPAMDVSYDLMYAGRLLRHKNVAALIRAVAKVKRTIPNVSCVIVGDGPDRATLIKLAQRLEVADNITFTGFLPEHSDVYGYMKSCRVFVQPSKREGFGLVVVEANACGVPVLTLDHPDNAATSLIREHINGRVFKNSSDLADKILNYLQADEVDRDLYRAEAGKYDWQTVTQNVAQAYIL